jgi:hypothetical protein
LKYKNPIDKNQKPAHTQKTKNKWDRANKDKYVELVNEGIQSSDLTLETAKDVEKSFLNLNIVLVCPIPFIFCLLSMCRFLILIYWIFILQS